MTPDTHSLPRWKPCQVCGEPKPLDDFRRVYSDQDRPRHSECNDCRNHWERAKRRRCKLGTTKKILRLLAEEKRLERIEVVLNKMLCQCGGRRRFGETLGELFRTGSPVDRRHATNAMINLMGVVSAERARLNVRIREEEEAAADIDQRHLGDDHPHSLCALHELGELRFDEGQGEEAKRLLREVVEPVVPGFAEPIDLVEAVGSAVDSAHGDGQDVIEAAPLGAIGSRIGQVDQVQAKLISGFGMAVAP